MSDTESARNDEGDAPAGPRNPWVSWVVRLVLAPVLYVLSGGPVSWLIRKHYLPDNIRVLLLSYEQWWVP